ncbi:MAG TPA: response regulator [Candidatus Omnitrophota bacterium]|nr:response regulator [Candidatus Omnitrophota bacterium]HPN55375.1 response regulator [Candidatus Omnitrophota bacterium]
MKQKILLVDDAREILDLMQAMLEGQGYAVIVATNGVEGLAKAKEERPQLIIADVLMPEMDGYLFFKELRKDPVTERIPVLIITARAKMEDSFRAIGVDGFLVKPIDANKLFTEVARELSVFIKDKDNISTQDLTPQTVEDLQQKSASGATLSAQSGGTSPGGKRILLYGYEKNVLREMSQQLEQKRCLITIADDVHQLGLLIGKIDPHIIFLEVKPDAAIPLESVLTAVHSALQSRDVEHHDPQVIPDIIIYKVHHAVSGVTAIASDVADTDNVLAQCARIGYTKYIGLYSPFTFYLKVKDFLRK